MNRLKSTFLSFLMLISAAACSSSVLSLEENKPEIKLNNLICSQVAILREAQEALDYGTGKLTDTVNEAQPLLLKARMANVDGTCKYVKDGDESGVDINFSIASIAVREDSGESQKFTLPYFIAIVDPANEIVTRRIGEVEYKFSSKNKIAEAKVTIKAFIPIPEEKLAIGPAYKVLIGFKIEK